MSGDTTAIITAIIPATAGAVVGLFWGIHTYKGDQKLKRKEIIFPLLEEFESHDMYYAKAILDDVVISEDKRFKEHKKKRGTRTVHQFIITKKITWKPFCDTINQKK